MRQIKDISKISKADLEKINESLVKLDYFLQSELRQATDKNVRIYEHWVDCMYDIQKIIVEEKNIDFKKGDKVFHKNLQLAGTFIEYDWTGKDEAWVEFDNEDGYEDCRHISTNQLVLVEKEFLNDDKSDELDR